MRRLLPLAAAAALRGRDARIRTALVAIAAGFAVALLLLAASVPGALAARSDRADARSIATADGGRTGRLVVAEVSADLGADGVSGLLIAPPSPGPVPLPPGVSALPPAGAMLVSAAMRSDLAGPDGALLRARLPYRIAGTIGPDGLLGPSEARFVAVEPALRPGGSASEVERFGVASPPEPLDPILSLLVVVGVLLLLLPIGIVVAVAGRFGAERRDRRLAALRLLGLSSRDVLVLAVLEAAVAALAGDLVGLGVFALGREAIGGVTVASLSVFPSDVAPPAAAAAAVLVVVPALLGVAALAGLAALRVEPLGVARRAPERRRRLRWRLVPPVLAVALLALGVTNLGGSSGTGLSLVGAGVALLLVGAVALLPWITEHVAGAVADGPLAWQIAMRRIRHDGTTSGRVVGAITAVLAGATALQLLFAGLAGSYTTLTGVQVSGTELIAVRLDPAAGSRMLALFADAPGGPALAVSDLSVHGHPESSSVPVLTGDCRALARIASVPGCRDGSSYLSPGGDIRPGALLDAAGTWRAPTARTSLHMLPNGDTFDGVVLATPGALPLVRQRNATITTIVASSSPELPVLVRAAAAIDPTLELQPLSPTSLSHRFDAVRRGLTVGLVLVLLLIGLVLLVSMGEQLRERRRALAVLAVLGLPRGTLVRSILAESALPVVLGGAVAAVTGAALGTALLTIVGRAALPDPGIVLTTAAVALVVPALVTIASLPATLRLLRPEHLRTE